MRSKLAILQRQKQEAVAVEDFDAAIELKDITDKLKFIGIDLNTLEQRKKFAIDGEDFETAKALKIKIENLREMISTLDPESPYFVQLLQEHFSSNQNESQDYPND